MVSAGSEPYQDEKFAYDQAENPSTHYLMNMNSLNQANQAVSLNRLPTLGEILANRTKLPVDLFTFYTFMRDVEGLEEYLDFWFDLVGHLNLCKHYVRCLRDSVARRSVYDRMLPTPNMIEDMDNGSLANRDSGPISPNIKHQSLSSSILLGLIALEHILEDNDSHRLSRFLRGDVDLGQNDPKIKELIEQFNFETDAARNSNATALSANYLSPRFPPTPDAIYGKFTAETNDAMDTSLTQLLDTDAYPPAVPHSVRDPDGHTLPSDSYVKRNSKILPELIEMLVKESPFIDGSSFITRNHLRESSHNLLLKYFVENSEKYLNLPPTMHSQILHEIEVEGRDDPDVFRGVRIYIFNKIEQNHLPKFLNFMAIRNVNHSNMLRIILGFFFCLVGFWVSFVLVFLDYRKLFRPVIIVPYSIGFYFLILSIYLIDPVLVWLGFSESFSKANGGKRLVKIRESFIRGLLIKRSLWVLCLIILFTAILTVLFSLVPGHKL